MFLREQVPIMAVLGSGGGFRAMVCLSGAVKALYESGVLNCSTYISGLSGSSWWAMPIVSKSENLCDKTIYMFHSKGVSWAIQVAYIPRSFLWCPWCIHPVFWGVSSFRETCKSLSGIVRYFNGLHLFQIVRYVAHRGSPRFFFRCSSNLFMSD